MERREGRTDRWTSFLYPPPHLLVEIINDISYHWYAKCINMIQRFTSSAIMLMNGWHVNHVYTIGAISIQSSRSPGGHCTALKIITPRVQSIGHLVNQCGGLFQVYFYLKCCLTRLGYFKFASVHMSYKHVKPITLITKTTVIDV